MKALSLYVHVPFCRSKCHYCDFPSRPLVQEWVEPWLKRLMETGAGSLEALEREWGGLEIDTVFAGGGTPTVIGTAGLRALLEGLGGILKGRGILREWTVEANPESLDAQRLSLMADLGVTRISLGIQSLQDKALRLSGRPCGERECRDALELLSREWRGSWSADLISGLPGQDPEGSLRDAREIASAGAGHVSLYSLILEPGTELERMAASDPNLLPGEEEAASSWDAAATELANRGFERYEVSNFARPGQECRHNLHYWRMDPYLGMGPAAVSTLPLEEGASLRMKEADLEAWLGGKAAEAERLSAVDSLKEWLLMGLRTAEGVAFAEARHRFGIDAGALLAPLFAPWISKGWAKEAGGRVSLGWKGMDLMDNLLRDCFLALDGDADLRRGRP